MRSRSIDSSKNVRDSVRAHSPGHIGHGQRAVFFASYGEETYFSRSVIQLTRALTARDYDVVIIRASNADTRPQWPAIPGERVPSILYRENVGYDFGSWSVGLRKFPKLAGREHVLLVNDSIVGPFASLDPLIDNFERSVADVWGAVSTLQFRPHLQSFFLGFHNRVLTRYPLRRFWRNIRELSNKQHVISEFEIGLTLAAEAEMLSLEAFIPAEVSVTGEQNPAIVGWKNLLDLGFPFVKRELLSNPLFADSRENLEQELASRYSVTVNDWFESVEYSDAPSA